MSGEQKNPLIVKRVKKVVGGGHHGGAWKIAYADFVTAMMAFFLLMWLLGSTTQGDLKGIADYFASPLKMTMSGGSGTGESNSVIQSGGGQDLSRVAGNVKKGSNPEDKMAKMKQAQQALAQEQRAKLKALKEELDQKIAGTGLKDYKDQIMIDETPEGLRIQIVDSQNRPMFDSGSAEMKPYARMILRELTGVLNAVDNRISFSGHTDAAPYAGGEAGYGNWELSSARAHAARRELIRAGLGEAKPLRVQGMGPSVLYDPNNPLNPMNRRIALLVLNKQTEEAIIAEILGMDSGIQNSLDLTTPTRIH